MKVNTHPLAPPLTLTKADPYTYPFSTVTIDFITDLLELNGYNALYVVVDYDLIKIIVFILYIKIIRIARLYYNNIYQRFKLSNRIILDKGP